MPMKIEKGMRKVWIMAVVFFTVTGVYLAKIAPAGWDSYLTAVQWITLGACAALTAEHYVAKQDPPKGP